MKKWKNKWNWKWMKNEKDISSKNEKQTKRMNEEFKKIFSFFILCDKHLIWSITADLNIHAGNGKIIGYCSTGFAESGIWNMQKKK